MNEDSESARNMYLAFLKFLNPPIDADVTDIFLNEDFNSRITNLSQSPDFFTEQLLKGAIRNTNLNEIFKHNSGNNNKKKIGERGFIDENMLETLVNIIHDKRTDFKNEEESQRQENIKKAAAKTLAYYLYPSNTK